MTDPRPARRRLTIAALLMASALPLSQTTRLMGGAPQPGESRRAPDAVGMALAPATTATTEAEANADGSPRPLSWFRVMAFNFAYVKVDDGFKARLKVTPANRLKMLRKFAAFEAIHNLREEFRANAKAVADAIDATSGNPPGGDPPPTNPQPDPPAPPAPPGSPAPAPPPASPAPPADPPPASPAPPAPPADPPPSPAPSAAADVPPAH